MVTIIAGSRGITDPIQVAAACDECGWQITHVFSGHAGGVDGLGELWAFEHKVPLTTFPAKWSIYGKQAGLLRNAEMATEAQALVAVWDGHSPGTRHMIRTATNFGLLVHVRVVS